MTLRLTCLSFLLAIATNAVAQDAAVPAPVAAAAPATTPAATPAVRALPPMRFYSSIADGDVYDTLKANPAFANLDRETYGTPLAVLVTHTLRPTAGGNAAGMFTAILSGSTLGLIPIVTNEELVVRYEVMLQGKPIATYSFSRTKTRAQNLWSMGGAGDKYAGLGKDGFEWLKSTAVEFAGKAAHDARLAQVQAEIDYYFPPAAPVATPVVPATPAAK